MPDSRGSVLIAFSFAFTCIFTGCAPPPQATKSDEGSRVVAVEAVAVAETEIEQTTLQPATVRAYFRSEIRPKVSGYLSEINADIGDVVKAGDPLAQIDIPEMAKQRLIIEARIVRKQAEEKRAESGVKLAEARVLSAEARLAEAESEMSSVEASLAAAEAEFTRTKDLVERGSLQDRMLDEVRKKRDSQRAAKQAVRSSIESAKAEVIVAQAQRNAAAADFDAARAETEIAQRELEEMDVMIGYSTITAPISGVISKRSAEPGDLVGDASQGSGTAPLFVINQIDKVRVHIPVPESDAARINPGDKVTLTFPSFQNEPPVEAEVTRTTGSLDASTRTMLVEVVLENEQGKFLPGMFGQASIVFSTKIAANVLPSRAVRFNEAGDAYVYVIGDDETVSVTAVETGFDDGKSIEIRSGLTSGQRVIDAHLKRFSDGQKVAVLSK